VKLAITTGLMLFRTHASYITLVSKVTTYDTPCYSTQECIKHTQMINYSIFNINKTQLLHTV
jgi:hypothetical protein